MPDVLEAVGSPSVPLLVFADDWGRHPSSCQHLIRRLRGRVPVVWANSIGTRRIKANAFTFRRGWEKIRNWGEGVVRVADQMWVVDLPMLPWQGARWAKALNRKLVAGKLARTFNALGLKAPVVITTLPYIGGLIGDLPRRSLVYYCTDDYSHWPEAERDAMQVAERGLVAEADVTLAVSEALLERLSRIAPCQFFPHAVDHAHFAGSQHADVAAELAAAPAPRIGFFGSIYEKLDFELLSALAARFPQATLALIGPVTYCDESLLKMPNVRLLGPQPYESIPRWIAGLDVLLLPYVNDDMIRQSSPLKLRECLASGKPTVSIDVPEVRKYLPHVRIGATREEFLNHVAQVLAAPETAEQIRARQLSVIDESWEQRADQLLEWLEPWLPATARPGA